MKQNTEHPLRRQLGSGNPGPHVLLIAGVHGDEYEPMEACNQLHERLEGQLLKGKVSFIANANPSAYQAGSRYGDDGLDMARICPGNSEGSSSEKAAFQVSEIIKTADYLVDMHTGGVLYDIYPLAGYMLHKDSGILKKQRQMALAFGLPVVWGTDPLPNGRTLSVARDAAVPAIYLEYGGGTGYRKHVSDAYMAGFLNLLRSFNMVAGEAQASQKDTYWVEDIRPDSGYLQGKMPSPADGIFISEVQPGKQVKKGDKWGEIVDPVSDERTAVFAEEDGLAFLLRNVVKVKKGDALGGILPITRPGYVRIDERGAFTTEEAP